MEDPQEPQEFPFCKHSATSLVLSRPVEAYTEENEHLLICLECEFGETDSLVKDGMNERDQRESPAVK